MPTKIRLKPYEGQRWPIGGSVTVPTSDPNVVLEISATDLAILRRNYVKSHAPLQKERA